MAKVFVALSGGVDSSVAALLLKRQGYDVTGVFMRCYNVDGCAERDAEDARRVAEHIGIPFYVFDFEKEYKEKVVEYMVDGYRKGITPNPDVMCNKKIKFGLFLKKALELGADYVATGHYVRLVTSNQRPGVRGKLKIKNQKKTLVPNYCLLVARDLNKDQSYFLWTLTQDQLKHCLFPIGDYLKSEVREIARKAGLPTAEKKDSQGICFLGKVSLDDFLKNYIKPKKGPIVTTEGKKIGEHQGVYFYTIGQRHIGVAGRQPVYIAEKDIKTNTLIIAEGEDNPVLHKKEIELTNINFINPDLASLIRANGSKVWARVRYRQPLAEATLRKSEIRNPKSETYQLVFSEPIKFVAAGQSAVFYSKKSELIGGGIIL